MNCNAPECDCCPPDSCDNCIPQCSSVSNVRTKAESRLKPELICSTKNCNIFGTHDTNRMPEYTCRKKTNKFKDENKNSLGSPIGLVASNVNFKTEGKTSDIIQARYATYLKAFARLHLSAETSWNALVIDDIMKEGLILYSSSQKEETNRIESPSDIYLPNEVQVLREFELSDFTFHIELMPAFKLNTSAAAETGAKGDGVELTLEDLLPALRSFFRQHKYGLLTVGSFYILIWHSAEAYFVFDACGRRVSDFQSDKDKGVAMLICLSSLDNVKHLIENLSSLSTKEPLILREMKVVKVVTPGGSIMQKEYAKRMPQYQVVNDDYAFLKAGLHLSLNRRDLVRNRSSLPVAVSALVVSKIDHPATWDSKMLDKIICFGVNFCQACWAHCAVSGIVDVTEFPSYFSMGQFKITNEIWNRKYEGTWRCVPGFKHSELSHAIRKAFEAGDQKLLMQINYQMYAVWKKGDFIYLLDPYRHRILGKPADSEVYDEMEKSATLRMFGSFEVFMNVFNHILLDSNRTSKFFLHTLKVKNIQKRQKVAKGKASAAQPIEDIKLDAAGEIVSLNEHICFEEGEDLCQKALGEISDYEDEDLKSDVVEMELRTSSSEGEIMEEEEAGGEGEVEEIEGLESSSSGEEGSGHKKKSPGGKSAGKGGKGKSSKEKGGKSKGGSGKGRKGQGTKDSEEGGEGGKKRKKPKHEETDESSGEEGGGKSKRRKKIKNIDNAGRSEGDDRKSKDKLKETKQQQNKEAQDLKDTDQIDKNLTDKDPKNKDIKDKDLNDKDLKGIDIKDKDLKDKDLKDKDLKGKDLKDKDLKDKDLKDKDLKDKDLKDKDLKDKDLKDENLKDKDLKDKDQKVKDLKDRDLKDKDLKGKDLKDKDLKDKDLKDKNLKDKDLKYKDVKDKDLKDKYLKDKDLKDMDLKDKVLKDNGLKDKDLKDKELKDKDLRDKDPKVKDLKDKDVKDTDIKDKNKTKDSKPKDEEEKKTTAKIFKEKQGQDSKNFQKSQGEKGDNKNQYKYEDKLGSSKARKLEANGDHDKTLDEDVVSNLSKEQHKVISKFESKFGPHLTKDKIDPNKDKTAEGERKSQRTGSTDDGKSKSDPSKNIDEDLRKMLDAAKGSNKENEISKGPNKIQEKKQTEDKNQNKSKDKEDPSKTARKDSELKRKPSKDKIITKKPRTGAQRSPHLYDDGTEADDENEDYFKSKQDYCSLPNPNRYPGYFKYPVDMAVVGSENGSYESICKLFQAAFKIADRVLTLTPWGNFVIFRCSGKRGMGLEERNYFLFAGCTCNFERFRHFDLSVGTAGLICFKHCHNVIAYIRQLRKKGRRNVEERKKFTVDDICRQYCERSGSLRV